MSSGSVCLPAPSPHQAAASTVIAIPIYDDWESASVLLRRLDDIVADQHLSARVLLIDDGSIRAAGDDFCPGGYRALDRVEVLRLRRNVGHQRAIALGLSHLAKHVRPDHVVVMDGDGEDAPEDVPRLLDALAGCHHRAVVFAERTKRSEHLAFRVFYGLYRLAHRLLTGIPVRVGNFSAIPLSHLDALVVVPELWNHYAAAVFKARLPRHTVPTARATRIAGEPRMNMAALIGHGLSALSVHAELVGVRLLIACGVVALAVCALLASVLAVRLTTSLAIPGWATTATGLLVIVLFQIVSLAVFFAFLVLHGRSQPQFIPLRDFSYFLGGITPLFERTPAPETPVGA